MSASDDAAPPARASDPQLLARLGGLGGVVDSGLPVVVFVLVNALVGLGVAVWAALATGVVVLGWRLGRRQPLQYVISGFLGVGLAAYVAHRLGRAEGFFLPGIALSAIFLAIFAGSLLVRWPLVGVIWSALEGRGSGWRADRGLRRAYTYATLLWVAMYASKSSVQGLLYLRHQPGWLAAARLAMGYPLYAVVLAGTVWLVRRAERVGAQENARRAGPDTTS